MHVSVCVCVCVHTVKLPNTIQIDSEQIRLRMKKYDELKQDSRITDAGRHLAKMPGYYRCCVYKWNKARSRDQWTLVCRCAPRVAKVVKELPNSIRRLLGLSCKFQKRKSAFSPESTSIVPPALENAVADFVVTRPQIEFCKG